MILGGNVTYEEGMERAKVGRLEETEQGTRLLKG